MREHGIGDDLRRHLEELLVEMTEEHGRILHKIDYFGKYTLGSARLETMTLLEGGDALADDAGALVCRWDDLGIGKDTEVGIRIRHLELMVREEAMTPGDITGDEAGELDRQHLLPIECEKPTDRTGEVGVTRTPALGLGP